jgi:membrane-associated phospholipid phosphatase
MSHRHRASALALSVVLLAPAAALAQDTLISPRASASMAHALAGGALATPVEPSRLALWPAVTTETATSSQPGEFLPASGPRRGNAAKAFFADVGRDYVAWFNFDTARTLGIGAAGAWAVSYADAPVKDGNPFEDLTPVSQSGQQYGNLSIQLPLAVGWWAVGSAMGSGRHAEAGRDLLRAQISAMSWTYAIKYTVGRTRPNGDPRSFPSGHASAAFATATVLQRHYGWKLGLPAYALGVFTAATRIADNKHWASDVIMGAAVGITAGRAVTMRMGGRNIRMSPAAAPGGLMMQFSVE